MSKFRWTQEEVRSALEVEPEGPGEAYTGVSTDTRAIAPGELFVALSGTNYDAHNFLIEAAAAGAAGAVVSRRPDQVPEAIQLWMVDDTLAALGRLGRHRRRALRARVVGITGTNGKTTTKDLVGAALSSRLRVHATEGNLNNQIGVPRTLLAAPDDAEALVVEMGTNEPGEIGILARIAEPDAGIITYVGEGHLEKLGSVHGVLIEKTALLETLPHDGLGLVADNPASLPARAREILGAGRLRIAGLDEDADLRPDGPVETLPDGTIRFRWRGTEVHVPLRGRHNIRNALLALGLAEAWGVPPEAAADGIRSLPTPKLRGEWKQIGGLTVIADCYNSNPSSLAAAIDLLASVRAAGRKVAVIGTMREMGAASEEIHRRAAAEVANRVGDGIDRIVATGAFADAFEAQAAELGNALLRERDPVAAYARLQPELRGDETVLLKASRGEALERWLPLLQGDWAISSSTPEA